LKIIVLFFKVRTWCHNLAEEVYSRLEKDRSEVRIQSIFYKKKKKQNNFFSQNKRRAKLLTVTCTLTTNETIARSCPLTEYSIDRFANDAYRILKQYNKSSLTSNIYSPAIINLGMSAGKFLDNVNTKSITDLFSKKITKNETTIISTENTINWQEVEEEDSDNDDRIIEKPITTLPIQGDFFRKFQKPDEQLKTPSKSEAKSTSSITSFFSRYASNENLSNSSPNKSDDRYITCSKCNKSILSWDMPEHEDFHYARELQMEENKNTSIIPKAIKRKTTNQNQTLDSFLNKKSKI